MYVLRLRFSMVRTRPPDLPVVFGADLPPHRFMRHNADRNLDSTARGLGATIPVPVTSVGEENVTMVEDG